MPSRRSQIDAKGPQDKLPGEREKHRMGEKLSERGAKINGQFEEPSFREITGPKLQGKGG